MSGLLNLPRRTPRRKLYDTAKTKDQWVAIVRQRKLYEDGRRKAWGR